MKIIKGILVTLLGLVIIYLISSFFFPKKLQLERSVQINAPAEDIYKEVTDFHTWNDWSVWHQLDSNLQNEYSSEMGGKGAWNSWKSEHAQVGDGKMEIVETEGNNFVRIEMTFGDYPDKNYSEFYLDEDADHNTTVRWTMDGAESPFYMRPLNMIMKPMIEESYEKSLAALKAQMEDPSRKKKTLSDAAGAHIMEVEAIQILSIMDSTDAAGISDKLREIYTEIMTYIGSTEGVEDAGMPLAIYHQYSEDKVILEGGIPFEGEAEEVGRIKIKQTPSGKTVMKIHYGDYANSEISHTEIDSYIQANNLTMSGSPWEIYANDPASVAESEIETYIYYPIK